MCEYSLNKALRVLSDRGKKNPQKHANPVNSDRRVFCDGLDLGMTDLTNSVVFIFVIGNTKTVE